MIKDISGVITRISLRKEPWKRWTSPQEFHKFQCHLSGSYFYATFPLFLFLVLSLTMKTYFSARLKPCVWQWLCLAGILISTPRVIFNTIISECDHELVELNKIFLESYKYTPKLTYMLWLSKTGKIRIYTIYYASSTSVFLNFSQSGAK